MYKIITLFLFIIFSVEIYAGVTISGGKISGGTINGVTVATDNDDKSSEEEKTKDIDEIQQNTQNSVEVEKDKVNEKKKPTKEEKNLATRRVALGLFFAEEGNRNKITGSEK